MVLDPVVSQATGARDHAGVSRGVQRGILMAFALSVPTALLLIPGELVFGFLRQPPDVTPIAASFSRISIIGVVPFYLFFALRQSLQAMAQTRPVVIAIVVSNFINFALDYTLIYGHFGFPALGTNGSAIATAISRWIMFGLLLYFGWKQLHGAIVPWRPESSSAGPLFKMLRIGLPVGIQSWLEIAVFSGGAIALGWFGAVPLAAHEIAINLAALTFMFPMGVSAAAAAMVGRAIGRGARRRRRIHGGLRCRIPRDAGRARANIRARSGDGRDGGVTDIHRRIVPDFRRCAGCCDRRAARHG
jgi:MATE family multidrug resistance protein